jgi:hypothetical protein
VRYPGYTRGPKLRERPAVRETLEKVYSQPKLN